MHRQRVVWAVFVAFGLAAVFSTGVAQENITPASETQGSELVELAAGDIESSVKNTAVGATVRGVKQMKLKQLKTAERRHKKASQRLKKASKRHKKASTRLLAQFKASRIAEEPDAATKEPAAKSKLASESLKKPTRKGFLHPSRKVFRRPEDQRRELQGLDVAAFKASGLGEVGKAHEGRRGGGALMTSGSFTMMSANRAGNSEDDEEELGGGQSTGDTMHDRSELPAPEDEEELGSGKRAVRYSLLAANKECTGDERPMGYVPNAQTCAEACATKSQRFIFAHGSSRCVSITNGKDTNGDAIVERHCKCYCEGPLLTSCTQSSNSNYNLYIISGVDMTPPTCTAGMEQVCDSTYVEICMCFTAADKDMLGGTTTNLLFMVRQYAHWLQYLQGRYDTHTVKDWTKNGEGGGPIPSYATTLRKTGGDNNGLTCAIKYGYAAVLDLRGKTRVIVYVKASCTVDMVSFLARKQMVRAWQIDLADLNTDSFKCWWHYMPDVCARAADVAWTKPAAADLTMGFSIA